MLVTQKSKNKHPWSGTLPRPLHPHPDGISGSAHVYIVEEPGFKNVKNKHLGMPPF